MANSEELAERDLALQIRKLRKKLRQIENLEFLDRPLTAEEQEKVKKKSGIRYELLELIEQQVTTATYRIIPSAPPLQQTPRGSGAQDTSLNSSEDPDDDNEDNAVVEEIHEEMKRKAEDDPEDYVEEEAGREGDDDEFAHGGGGDDKRVKYEEKTNEKEDRNQGKKGEMGGKVSGAEGSSQSSASTSKSKKKSPKKKKEGSPPLDAGWASVKFLVRELEGHNDLVCAVACQGSMVISGGRDTMVKVWDSDTGAEIRSIGGHTGTITSLMIIPPLVCQRLNSAYDLPPDGDNKLALTGSTDCTIRLWCLSTGEMLRSMYTYNSVECMGLMHDGGFIVSGSDGGKVELWDAATGDNLFTTLGHDDGVTCIKVEGNRVVTTSADGIIKLWELRDKSLHTLFASENVTSRSSSKPIASREIKSLVYKQCIYYGDDGLNIKALEWKKGVVHKLKHHLGDFGSTGAMCSTGDLLACAGYDLDNGQAYINFWNLPEEVYLATLNDQDTSRVITMDCTTTDMGYLRIVTGGQEVKVWDRIPKKRYSPQDAVPIEFVCQYSTQAQDSDIDSDSYDSDTDDADNEARHHGRRRWSASNGEHAQAGWMGSWCAIV